MARDAAYQGAVDVVRRLRERGFRALLAGGCVRDMELGRTPVDYDIATDAGPAEVADLFPDTYAVGAAFGVVRVRLDQGEYEVARFRQDHGTTDGRHPASVTFAGEREDARRRDFTINGLFFDPVDDRVIDYVGGVEDIRRGVVRTIGAADERFREDRLRMMRAVRFASRFHWPIESSTEAAIEAEADGLQLVSRERLRDEMGKVLVEGGAPLGVRWLLDLGLMAHLVPEVVAMEGVRQPPEFHPEGDVLTHTLLMLGMMRRPSVELAMGVLLHDVGKPQTFEVADRIRFNRHPRVGAEIAEAACRRLRFSSHETAHIARLVDLHHRFMHVHRMRPSTLKRFLRVERFEDHLELHRLDCLASHRNLDTYHFCRSALESLSPEQIRPLPLVTGDDLIELGFAPGPLFGQVLAIVEDAQMDGRVSGRDEALELARETCAALADGAEETGQEDDAGEENVGEADTKSGESAGDDRDED